MRLQGCFHKDISIPKGRLRNEEYLSDYCREQLSAEMSDEDFEAIRHYVEWERSISPGPERPV